MSCKNKRTCAPDRPSKFRPRDATKRMRIVVSHGGAITPDLGWPSGIKKVPQPAAAPVCLSGSAAAKAV